MRTGSESVQELIDKTARTPFAGISADVHSFEQLRHSLLQNIRILEFKNENRSQLAPTVVLVGGTGTGKSTIFNSLLGFPVSRTGVKRPQTLNPVIALPRKLEALFQRADLFPGLLTEWQHLSSMQTRSGGHAGVMTFVTHDFAAWRNMILVDSPDVDSIEIAHRKVTESLYALADLVVFVTSQEKYADNRPFAWLKKSAELEKPHLVVMNKVDSNRGSRDFQSKLDAAGVSVDDGLLMIPRHAHDENALLNSRELVSIMDGITSMDPQLLLDKGRRALAGDTLNRLSQVLDHVEKERAAREGIIDRLDTLERETWNRMLQSLDVNLDERTRSNMKAQLRLLLSKYDVLRVPRRWIRRVVLAPLDFIGVLGKKQEHDASPQVNSVLRQLPQETLQAAAAFFQRGVSVILQKEAPDSSLYGEMCASNVFFTSKEFQDQCVRELGEIDAWVRLKFQELKDGLSARKKLGMVSASVLWGILLVSVEAVLGGGITLLDMLLNSAIVPFIPRGVVELVVLDEIKKIGEELDSRCKRAYKNVLSEQHSRVTRYVENVFPQKQDVDYLASLREWIVDIEKQGQGTQ